MHSALKYMCCPQEIWSLVSANKVLSALFLNQFIGSIFWKLVTNFLEKYWIFINLLYGRCHCPLGLKNVWFLDKVFRKVIFFRLLQEAVTCFDFFALLFVFFYANTCRLRCLTAKKVDRHVIRFYIVIRFV